MLVNSSRRDELNSIMMVMMMMMIIIIIIINMHTDRCGNTGRQKYCAKGSGKKLKYKSLCIGIQRMWNLKFTFIPIIIGATGIVTRSLRKNLEAVPGNTR